MNMKLQHQRRRSAAAKRASANFKRIVGTNKPAAAITPFNGKLPLDEERRLVRAGQRGDTNARNRVVLSVHGMVWYQVMRQVTLRNKQEQEDAVNYIISVLCDKFHKFDLKRRVRYITYASYWIQQALRRYASRMGLVAVPDRFLMMGKISPEKIAADPECGLFAQRATNVESITCQAAGERYDGWQKQHLSKEASPFQAAEDAEELRVMRQVMNELPWRERRIVVYRYFRGMTLREVGERMNLTRERVRQIQEMALERMKGMMMKDMIRKR